MYQPESIDPASFEGLFRLHYTFLCATAYHMLEDEEAAKDVVQDFFLYCWDKREVIRITQNFKGYAIRAVRNACINYLKRSGKTSFDEPEVLENAAKQPVEEDMEQTSNRDAALWAAIERLPAQRRQIFLLSNRDGFKYKDIADQLNISINTVKTQIKLAYQYLRKECEWMIKLICILFF
jgi:RNA polymerase sigma-70 factor (ECF subfamily)